MFNEVSFYCLSELEEIIFNLQREVEFVSFTSSPQYNGVGTHKLEDLKDKNNNGGICVQSPYNIIIELNMEHEIDSIEIAGYGGNKNAWDPGNGAYAVISVSKNKSDWTIVGNIPGNYSQNSQIVKITKSSFKYIRLQHTSYLGIGYLKLIKAK